MISHMDGLEAQISSIFRRFQRKEICFNCLRSIGSLVFLLWTCLISGERCIFSRIVTYFKERKVSRFLFVISTASLYAVENDYVFGPTHLPLLWTGWKPRFHRFFEDFKGRKYALIVCAVSAAPFSFFENVWFRVKDAYFRELLRISKEEKWVDFCL